MTPEEYTVASKRYRNAINFMGGSGEDYISGRCLVLNHLLIPGLILQVVAIEKMMKAIVACQDQAGNVKPFKHNLTMLFNEINQYPEYDIGRFEYYIPKLEHIYKLRYHDGKRTNGFSYGGPDDEGVIDDFYIELVDQILLIPEFKYRCGLLETVFDPFDQYRQFKRWAYKCNTALAKKIEKWRPFSEVYFTKP